MILMFRPSVYPKPSCGGLPQDSLYRSNEVEPVDRPLLAVVAHAQERPQLLKLDPYGFSETRSGHPRTGSRWRTLPKARMAATSPSRITWGERDQAGAPA